MQSAPSHVHRLAATKMAAALRKMSPLVSSRALTNAEPDMSS
jgi:hypothetical protein